MKNYLLCLILYFDEMEWEKRLIISIYGTVIVYFSYLHKLLSF